MIWPLIVMNDALGLVVAGSTDACVAGAVVAAGFFSAGAARRSHPATTTSIKNNRHVHFITITHAASEILRRGGSSIPYNPVPQPRPLPPADSDLLCEKCGYTLNGLPQ